MTTATTINQRLDDILERIENQGSDASLTLDVAVDTAWAGSFRYTRHPFNPNGPDESVVFFVVGEAEPEEIIRLLLDAFEKWWSAEENR